MVYIYIILIPYFAVLYIIFLSINNKRVQGIGHCWIYSVIPFLPFPSSYLPIGHHSRHCGLKTAPFISFPVNAFLALNVRERNQVLSTLSPRPYPLSAWYRTSHTFSLSSPIPFLSPYFFSLYLSTTLSISLFLFSLLLRSLDRGHNKRCRLGFCESQSLTFIFNGGAQ